MNEKPQRYAVVAMQHRPAGTVEFVKSLSPDEPITLVREPDNKYDANAVQVWARGRHIGYIPKSQNAVLAKFIDANGMPWTEVGLGFRVMAADHVISISNPTKAVAARLHLGSNTYPLVEIV